MRLGVRERWRLLGATVLGGLLAAAVLVAVAIAAAFSQPAPTATATPTWQLQHYTATGYDRSFKMDLVDELPEPPQLVIMGGSRCTRFEPSFATGLTGLPAMNVALSNFRPEDAWAILGHLYARSPDTRVRVVWGVTANSFTDMKFAPGLVHDERLSRAFPAERIAQQTELLGTVGARDLLLKNRFSARGLLLWNVYDARRVNGLTLSASLDRWTAHYARGARWASREGTRARSYFEQTVALLNQHGVAPLIVLMPYQPRALAALQRTAWRQRQEEIEAYLKGLQLTYDFRLLDYTEVSSFEGRPGSFYDGAHITVANARILMQHAVRAAPECFE